MSEQVECPECGGRLNVPGRLIGKQVRCSKCKAIFEARPTVDDIAEAEDVGAEEPERFPLSNPENVLFWARLSALLVFIGSCVSLGAVGFLFLIDLILVSTASSGSYSSSTLEAMYWLMVLLVGVPGLLATLATDTGLVFGLFGPHRKNAFGLCIAVIAVSGVHLLFLLIGLAVADSPGKAGLSLSTWRVSEASRLGTTLLVFETVFWPETQFDVVYFLTGLLEVARLVLLALWVQAVLRNYKRDDNFWLVTVVGAGGAAVFLMLLGVMLRLTFKSTSSSSSLQALAFVHYGLPDLVVAGVWVVVFLLSMRLRRQLGFVRLRDL
jgi:hypothetical protein